MRKNGEGMLVVWEYGCTTPSICRGPWGDGLPGARKASNRCPLLWMFVKGVKQVLKLRSRRYRKVVVCTRQEATRLVDHGSSPLPLARTCRGADPTGSVSAVELGTTIQCPPKGAVSAGGRHLGGWRRGQPLLPRQIRVPTRHKTNMRGGWARSGGCYKVGQEAAFFQFHQLRQRRPLLAMVVVRIVAPWPHYLQLIRTGSGSQKRPGCGDAHVPLPAVLGRLA